MTKNETEALVKYLTFSMETMCDDMSQYIPNEAVGIMYDRAYGIVEDLERTLDTLVEMTPKINNKQS